ncbi:hypothetical protein, partial [Burkholderia perseverans]|uniref:hypothetical protein n=1 Tax=Burkholderia perseverans TaxID=2615214 RepID=UPI001FEEEE3B
SAREIPSIAVCQIVRETVPNCLRRYRSSKNWNPIFQEFGFPAPQTKTAPSKALFSKEILWGG